MELFEFTQLHEINRVLIAINQLVSDDETCTVNGVKSLCSSISLSGTKVDYWHILRLCQYVGFIEISQGKVHFLPLGKTYINLNESLTYEVSDAQLEFVAKQFIFEGRWQSSTRGIMQCFTANYDEFTYHFDRESKSLPARYRAHVHLFKRVGILSDDGQNIASYPELCSSCW